MAHEVAFVQSAELADRHRDEVVEVLGSDDGRGQRSDPRVVDWRVIADDRVHDLGELLTIAQAQWIRLRQLDHLPGLLDVVGLKLACHSLSSWRESTDLRHYLFYELALYLACGANPGCAPHPDQAGSPSVGTCVGTTARWGVATAAIAVTSRDALEARAATGCAC